MKEPLTSRARLRRLLFAGLLILAPAYLTIHVLRILFRAMDGIFAPIVDHALGVHIPGLGLLLTLLAILALGWLSSLLAGRRAISWLEAAIRRVPVAKQVYGATKGVLEALSQDQAEAFKRVVLIEYPRRGVFAMGFVTGNHAWASLEIKGAASLDSNGESGSSDLDFVATESNGDEAVFVFVPTTPNPTSGYLVIAPRSQVYDCAISIEDGVRLIISGGILRPEAVRASQPTPPAAPAARAEE